MIRIILMAGIHDRTSEPVRQGRLQDRSRGDLIFDACLAMAIFLVALVFRLTWVLEFVSHPLGRIPYVDGIGYLLKAEDIYNGKWLPDRPFYEDPLLPYLLACLMKLMGLGIVRLRVALAVMGSLTPPILFYAGRSGIGRPEGMIAGLVAAMYGPLVFADGLVEKERLAALTSALALCFTGAAFTGQRSVLTTASAGIAWGVLALFRANAILIAPLGIVWCLVSDGIRRPVRGLAFGLGFALPLLPATAVNAVVSRPSEFILTTWQAGANFYIDNGPKASGGYVTLPFVRASPLFEAADFSADARRRSGRRLSYSEISYFWYKEALDRWRTAPIASLRLLLRKIGFVFNKAEIPDSSDAEFVRIAAAPALVYAWIGFGALIPLCALSIASERQSAFRTFVMFAVMIGLLSTTSGPSGPPGRPRLTAF